ncbi:MAG: DUF4192 domain-containing protein [Carbonactinosporaceae bacterium]
MTTTPTQASSVLRLSCPGELVEVVPYLLGFHPEDSVVLLALEQPGRRVGLTVRIDLPPPGDVAGYARECAARFSGSASAGALLLVFAADAGPASHRPLCAAFDEAFAHRGVQVHEALLVGRDRWCSLLCHDASCCPPEGVPFASGTSVVAAAATYAGLTARPDRASLADILDPEPSRACAATARTIARAVAELRGRRAAGESAESLRAESERLLRGALDGAREGARPGDDEVARLVAGLGDIQVRDSVAAWTGPEIGEAARNLWLQLARRVPPPHDAAPLTLAAWVSYLQGEGAFARTAVERALRSDQGYSLAQLLRGVLDAGIPPRLMRRQVALFARHRPGCRPRVAQLEQDPQGTP